MTVIYTNSANRVVSLDVPITPVGEVEVTVRSQGNIVHEAEFAVSDDVEFTLPFALSQDDADLEVTWRFAYQENSVLHEYTDTTEVTVITPILPFPEIMRVLGPDFDEQQAQDVERAVRNIIQAHTGQFFGKFVGKRSVTGSGEPYLRLPMRLIAINNLNGNTYWNESFALRGSGWYLQSKAMGVPTVRADFDGWHESAWAYSNRAPIVAPYSKVLFNFAEHAEYVIDGVWGWRQVPLQVQEAARLLINDYACADSQYRDRFLTSMTAADWRIQFHEGAFSNTGNVRANQLLAEFVLRRGWVVV